MIILNGGSTLQPFYLQNYNLPYNRFISKLTWIVPSQGMCDFSDRWQHDQ
jgi:hypothetical protein